MDNPSESRIETGKAQLIAELEALPPDTWTRDYAGTPITAGQFLKILKDDTPEGKWNSLLRSHIPPRLPEQPKHPIRKAMQKVFSWLK